MVIYYEGSGYFLAFLSPTTNGDCQVFIQKLLVRPPMNFEAVLYHCTNQLFMRNKVIVECVQDLLKIGWQYWNLILKPWYFQLSKKLGVGLKYNIHIVFSGQLTDGLSGFYRSSYMEKATNTTKWVIWVVLFGTLR